MSFPGMATHSCTTRRNTPVKVDRGGLKPAYANVKTGVRFALYPRGAAIGGGRSVQEMFGQEISYDYVGLFREGTDLRPNLDGGTRDEVTSVVERRTGTAISGSFKVVGVHTMHSMPRGVLVVLLEKIS